MMRQGAVGIDVMIRLAFGAIVAIIAIILIARFTGIFFPGSDELESAKQNFDLLATNLERLAGSPAQVTTGEMFLNIPKGYYIVAFDAGMQFSSRSEQDNLQGELFETHEVIVTSEAGSTAEATKQLILKPPEECTGACLCLYSERPTIEDPQRWLVTCKTGFSPETRFASAIPVKIPKDRWVTKDILLGTHARQNINTLPEMGPENYFLIAGTESQQNYILSADISQRTDNDGNPINVVFATSMPNGRRTQNLYAKYTSCPGEGACAGQPWNTIDQGSTLTCGQEQSSVCKYDSNKERCIPACVPVCDGLIGIPCLCLGFYYTAGYCEGGVQHYDYYIDETPGQCALSTSEDNCASYPNAATCQADPCAYGCWLNEGRCESV